MIELDGIQYLSMAEAAQRIGLAEKTLRLKAAAGELRALKVGQRWHTTEAWVAEYLRTKMNFQEDGDLEK